jgi:hypothetical protein
MNTFYARAYKVKDIRETHSNAYRFWTYEDDNKLMRMEESGISKEEMVKRFGRNLGAIESRLAKIKLRYNINI